jgi:O-6-methylguanine DNA methyltransferase
MGVEMSGGYCVFETALGTCGIAWRQAAADGAAPVVTHLQLPEANPAATERRIARNSRTAKASEPPPEIAALIKRVQQHLSGRPQDFRGAALDLAGADELAWQVYAAAREIPPGQTRTYGEIAKSIGQPGAAQAVGEALASNPIPLIVPCHRVTAAGGKPGGFSAPGGLATKARLLELEGGWLTPQDRNLKFAFDASETEGAVRPQALPPSK